MGEDRGGDEAGPRRIDGAEAEKGANRKVIEGAVADDVREGLVDLAVEEPDVRAEAFEGGPTSAAGVVIINLGWDVAGAVPVLIIFFFLEDRRGCRRGNADVDVVVHPSLLCFQLLSEQGAERPLRCLRL